MKTTVGILTAFLTVSFAGEAFARGRYTRGRTQYFRKCGVCFSMGWKWAPSGREQKFSVTQLARKMSPARVCTFMRRNRKQLKGPACYPGKMTYRQKMNILYYIVRRLQGKIKKPRLRRLSPRLVKKARLERRAAAQRKRALQRHKNLLELRRVRRRSKGRTGRWTGSLKPKTSTVPSRAGTTRKGR